MAKISGTPPLLPSAFVMYCIIVFPGSAQLPGGFDSLIASFKTILTATDMDDALHPGAVFIKICKKISQALVQDSGALEYCNETRSKMPREARPSEPSKM